MGIRLSAAVCLLLATSDGLLSAGPPAVLEHVVVYQEEGRYGGWPANHGIWSWGDEIVVGFSAAYFQKKSPDRHQYDSERPEEPRLARSLDGGHTWTVEAPPSLLPPEQGGQPVALLREPIDFRSPGFALTLRFTNTNQGPSRLFYSYDRGKTWNGPYAFPMLGQTGIAARTDYIVNGSRDAFVFLSAAKTNGREGRPLCARTTDGGLHWSLVSWIGEEPSGFAIMPSTVRLSPQTLLCAVRVHEDADHDWIDLYQSSDNAARWQYLARPVPTTGGHGGNPPSLIRLRDGRLCLTYGFREAPHEIRARLSEDGKTWGSDIVLRQGATWEIGYTRSVQRPDGKIVTVYYYPQHPESGRIIEATIWDPGTR
jgi:BNR repeat-like domain